LTSGTTSAVSSSAITSGRMTSSNFAISDPQK